MRPMWVRHNSPLRLPDRARRSRRQPARSQCSAQWRGCSPRHRPLPSRELRGCAPTYGEPAARRQPHQELRGALGSVRTPRATAAGDRRGTERYGGERDGEMTRSHGGLNWWGTRPTVRRPGRRASPAPSRLIVSSDGPARQGPTSHRIVDSYWLARGAVQRGRMDLQHLSESVADRALASGVRFVPLGRW
jgi:hypothetical protein